MKEIKKEPQLNIHNSRSEKQKQRMETAQEKMLCPFCPEGLIEIHKNEIIRSNEDWLLTENPFPYEGTKHHYLLVSKEHWSKPEEMTPSAWATMGEMFNYLIKEKKINGGSLLMRFGDMKTNGTSVEHIHIHVISGNADESYPENERESIKVKLGYKKI